MAENGGGAQWLFSVLLPSQIGLFPSRVQKPGALSIRQYVGRGGSARIHTTLAPHPCVKPADKSEPATDGQWQAWLSAFGRLSRVRLEPSYQATGPVEVRENGQANNGSQDPTANLLVCTSACKGN